MPPLIITRINRDAGQKHLTDWEVLCNVLLLLLLLLLSRFSRVRLFATPWTAAHQAPLSMRFSRQEHWSGVPCAAAAAKLLQSCLTLCDPIDGSPPGSSVPGTLQARALEWVPCAAAAAKLLQLYPTLCDPVDHSPPGSPVPGTLQARALEWVPCASGD